MMILVDYQIDNECENKEAFYICYKCGKCGREFDEQGIMVGDGGKTVDEEEE